MNIGILCWPMSGHLNAILPLGMELVRRGHSVLVVGIADIQEKVRQAGLQFALMAETEIPFGSLEKHVKVMGTMSRLAMLRTGFGATHFTELTLRDAPAILRAFRPDLLLVDQSQYEGGTVAELLDVPYLTVATDVPQLTDEAVPPMIFGWRPGRSYAARIRNSLGYRFFYSLSERPRAVIAAFRKEAGLPQIRFFDDLFSRVGFISQLPQQLDFPRAASRPWLHYTGPFHTQEGRQPVAFPYERLNGKPIVYCSFGSIVSGMQRVFAAIGEACEGINAQLVLSLGGVNDEPPVGKLPASAIVVSFAPQIEMLRRASVMITHGGLNSVLEALTNGVPLIVVPKSLDTFASAARIVHAGVGRRLLPRNMTSARIRREIETVLTDDRYRVAASRMRENIAAAGGVVRAADLAEQVGQTAK